MKKVLLKNGKSRDVFGRSYPFFIYHQKTRFYMQLNALLKQTRLNFRSFFFRIISKILEISPWAYFRVKTVFGVIGFFFKNLKIPNPNNTNFFGVVPNDCPH
jgi:hypothetical protein